MKVANKVLATALLIFAGGGVKAGDTAHSVVAATKLAPQLSQAREACEAEERTADIESLAPGNPVLFYNTDSRSPRWPEIRDAYVRYAISACVPQDIQAYVDLSASIYESALSEEELMAVLRFYESDAGKKFAAVGDLVSTELNKKMHAERRETLERGGIRFDAEMRALTR
jgi:hypothetical protein